MMAAQTRPSTPAIGGIITNVSISNSDWSDSVIQVPLLKSPMAEITVIG
jgi:hypothetical protein